MGTEYKDITVERKDGREKIYSVKQFAGSNDFDGLAIQLTTNTEKNQRTHELDFYQYIHISRDDIPAVVDALQKYYDGNYPTRAEDIYEQSHFNGTCSCRCTEDDEIYEM